MPRTFLLKPRPLEDQVPVTSEPSSVTSSVDAAASPWLPGRYYDVNNNSVVGRSLFGASGLDLTAIRSTDSVARWPLDVAGGLPWWSTSAATSAAQAGPASWRDDRGGRVTSLSKRSTSPPSGAASAAEPVTGAADDAQSLWWSPSPHSDVSASGTKTIDYCLLHLSAVLV